MRIERALSNLVESLSRAREFDRALSTGSPSTSKASFVPTKGPGGDDDEGSGGIVGRALTNDILQLAIFHFTVKVKEDDGNKTVTIQAGAGSDNIQIRQGDNDTVIITNNGGQAFTLKVDAKTTIIIESGGGDDQVDATGTQQGAPYKLTLNGGTGDDQLFDGNSGDILIGGEGSDVVVGNGGDDYIDGQRGDDSLIGGDGKDVIYGGYGSDALYGDGGVDYLDAGQDDDIAFGGEGDDIVSGGRGNDALYGGKGGDVLITSFGQDSVFDTEADGGDKIYAKDGDAVDVDTSSALQIIDPNKTADGKPLGSSITVEGTPEFKDRIDADLDTMRGMPLGQFMLSSLDTSGHKTTIREYDKSGGEAKPAGGHWELVSPDENGRPGPGTDAEILINPSDTKTYDVPEDWTWAPPVVTLFHEMAHAQDYVLGTLIPRYQRSHNPGGSVDDQFIDLPGGGWSIEKNSDTVRSLERSAVGLPYDQDGNPETNEPNDRLATENNFRDQLGLPRREYY
jgi:NleD-like pathogen effector protein (putative zinc metallopeptidase)/hemolysin type calcium-binding protein